jgi:hypothetical protein
MKIGDKVKCVSLWGPSGKSDYLKLGEYYIVKLVSNKKSDSNFIIVNVPFVNNTNLDIAYHPSLFRTLKQERKEKLKKIKRS